MSLNLSFFGIRKQFFSQQIQSFQCIIDLLWIAKIMLKITELLLRYILKIAKKNVLSGAGIEPGKTDLGWYW